MAKKFQLMDSRINLLN